MNDFGAWLGCDGGRPASCSALSTARNFVSGPRARIGGGDVLFHPLAAIKSSSTISP